MLYIFGGLPGSGKTTLAKHLSRTTGSAYIRIDTIEEVMQDLGSFVATEGYEVAYRLATDNLENGLHVVVDSVNPILVTRKAWREVANTLEIEYLEIEIVCSDKLEHRKRLETRKSNRKALTWEEVQNRDYEPWDGSVVFDTAGETVEGSKKRFEKEILSK